MKKLNFRNLLIVFLIVVFISFHKSPINTQATGIPISSCVGLLAMSDLSEDFYLTQDIDCSATAGWNGGSGWLPLGTFTGTLDGQGFAITDLYINRNTTDNVGLFSVINGGHVFNLSLIRVNITGKDYTGALSGKVGTNATTIEDITVSGSVSGGSYVGGIIGMTQTATINRTQISGTISATDTAGGLSGFILNSAIDDADSSATVVITSSSYVGGLVAQADDSTFNNAHVTGAVSGPTYVGGFMGLSVRSTFDNCSASGNVTGVYNQGNTGGLIASTTGVGSIENCSASGNVSGGIVAGGLVGNQDTGTTIDNSYSSGNVSDAANGVGGLVGVSNSTISNSYATGNVAGQVDGIGGLVGENYSTISESWATGTITSFAGKSVGGLVGNNSSKGIIRKSYSTGGSVSSPGIGVGGLTGENYGTVEKSYSTKNVTGSNQVGGLSGDSFGAGTISNCYATGNISISSADGFGGGLIGMTGGGTLTNSYSIGSKVTSPGTFNGSIGSGQGGTTITNSYWDVTTSGVGGSGDNVFGVVGKTTAELKNLATFATWSISTGSDFSTPTIWYIGSSYPELHYTPGATTTSATSIALTGATLRGSLNYYFGVNGYFQYRELGASSWISTAPQSLVSLGVFSQAITGLTSNTNYEYRTVIDYGTGYNYGTIESFQTLKQDPTPTAQAPSDVFPTTAKLKGEVTTLGDYSPVEASFRYRKVGDIDWTTTTPESILVAGEVETTITGLTVGTNYEYQLKIVFGVDQEVFGTLTTFQTRYGTTSSFSYSTSSSTTTSTKPIVSTYTQDSLSEEEHNNSHYYIQYKKEGETQWVTTNKKPMPQNGIIEETIEGIQNNINYEYQYVIETKDDKKIYSQVNKFVSSSSPFVLKAFTLILSTDDISQGSVVGGGIFYNGQKVTIKAKEKVNYKFVGWQEDGIIINQNKEYTFTINSHRNIKAIFAKQTREEIIMSLQLQLIGLLQQLLAMLQRR